jgi:hypothetical protein
MKELLFVDQARLTWPQTAPTSRQKATTTTPFNLYRQDGAKRKSCPRAGNNISPNIRTSNEHYEVLSPKRHRELHHLAVYTNRC